MTLVDTHAHLYLDAFDPDREAVLARARAAGLEAILLPAVDAASIRAALDLAERHRGLCYAMTGVHPSYVREASEADWQAVEALARHPRVVAVGESGLDYYWDRSFVDLQHAALRRQARLAMAADLPLVLHNRDRDGRDGSSRDLIAILHEERAAHPHGDRLRGVFHCFGGPAWLAEEALALGFHLGVGGSLTYRNGAVAAALEGVPLERIVLETDAPYLAPVPHRGRRNEPAHVVLVAERLAALRGLAVDDVARVTTAAARSLFRLPPSACGGSDAGPGLDETEPRGSGEA